MFMYLLNDSMFTIVMTMPCDIIGDITCVMWVLCKLLIVCGITCIISFSYVVCIIRITLTCFIQCNIVIELIISFLQILYPVYLIIISNTITIVMNRFIYVICVVKCSIIVFLIKIIFNIINMSFIIIAYVVLRRNLNIQNMCIISYTIALVM